jgi:hypothetical protein
MYGEEKPKVEEPITIYSGDDSDTEDTTRIYGKDATVIK